MSIKNGIILTACIGTFVVLSSVIGGIMLQNKIKNSTIIYKAETTKIDNADVNSNNTDTSNSKKEEVKQEEKNVNQNDTENNSKENTSLLDSNKEEQKTKVDDGSIDLSILGEIMLGGEVTKNLNYNYLDAFKEIYTIPKSADFTYANFSTNITNLDKIDSENVKSKYLVTKDVISALSSIGVDSVSIASDHMSDYPEGIFKNTVDLLEKNEIFVAGRENLPVYLQKGDKKIAIISTNSIINGTANTYTKQGISIYTKENLEKNIKEAKQSASLVIVDVHFGKEHSYGLNDQMRTIAKTAIDLGADMVIGSHALGVYPIVKYKDKPIIYSAGFLISDTDYNLGKESFMFNVKISKESKIENITMTPIYTQDKKKVKLYKDYDPLKEKAYIELFNKWHIENSLNSKIENDTIVVGF